MFIQYKNIYSETLSPKKYGQISAEKKGCHNAVLVSFTETPPAITIANNTGEQISSP